MAADNNGVFVTLFGRYTHIRVENGRTVPGANIGMGFNGADDDDNDNDSENDGKAVGGWQRRKSTVWYGMVNVNGGVGISRRTSGGCIRRGILVWDGL